MTVRLTYCDTKLTSIDELRELRAANPSDTLEVVVLQSVATHPLWRNSHARIARTLDLVVADGGKPASGTLVLTSLAADVVRSDRIALATPQDNPKRSAVAVTLAPDGRGQSRRMILVGTDLTGAEWQRHRAELQQRLTALGHPAHAPTAVLAVDHKTMQLPSLDQPDEAQAIAAVSGAGGALVFDVELD